MKTKVKIGLAGAVLATAFGVFAGGGVANAQVPAGLTVTKTCAVAGGGTVIPQGGTAQCTIAITNATAAAIAFAEPIQVQTFGSTATSSPVTLVNGITGATGPDVDTVVISNTAGTNQTVSVACFGATCDLLPGETIVIVEGFQVASGPTGSAGAIAGAAGGPVNESIRFGAAGVVPLIPTGGLVTVAPAAVTPNTTTVTLAGCQAGTTFVVGGTLVNTINPGGTITCSFDLDDNEVGTIVGGPNAGGIASEFVSSGFVTVNLNAGFPAGLGLVGTPGGGSITIRCPDAVTTGPNVCDRVSVTFTSLATTALVNAVSVLVSYDPDIDPQNTSTQATFGSLFAIVQPVGNFIQPTGLLFTCSGTVPGPFVGPFPGQVGVINNLVGVGILGTTPVTCSVQTTVGGVVTTVAPGTFEITSLNGALVDASGRTTTNLRIACGQSALAGVTTVVTPGAPINLNNCTGVQFAVVGAGVGFVEIRARYEPATVAELAGIFGLESAVNVAFVAPLVQVVLTLSPNPVAVGQTGTATVRFGSFGTRILRDPVTGVPFVDPTTGLPIATTAGSILNGNVIFTIDNTAIAAFDAAQPNVATQGGVAPTSAGGFVTTANQTVRRCGFFPTTALPGVGAVQGTLGSFFGGCETATATYRGVTPGVTNLTASFIADLPGAFGSSQVGLTQPVAGLLGLFAGSQFGTPAATLGLEVIGTAPSGNVELVRGCNNITPTVGESASAFAARVAPSGALVSIFEYQAATNTFRGFSPQAGAPNDLAAVTRLRPVFICVNASATLSQPAA